MLMRRLAFTALSFVLLTAAATAATVPSWPQFRGPGGLSVASEGRPPVHFGPQTNLLWKVALPSGNSSPCIWGDRIFLTAFDKQKLETLCLDRKDGRILWRKAAPAQKFEPTHKLGNPATPTPTTDGERVYVYFGSFGVLAYDFAGVEQWNKPLPPPIVEFGTSASPILAGELLVICSDADMDSYLLAVDRRTGREVWRVDRAEFRRSFSTPFLWRHDGVEEIVVAGSLWAKSYDVKDGKERWTMRGLARVANASPTAGSGLLFVSSWNIGGDPGERISMPPHKEFLAANDKNKDGKLTKDEFPPGPFLSRFSQIDVNKDGIVTREEYENMAAMFEQAENALFAVKPGARGESTSTHVLWKVEKSLPYVSSPLHYHGRVFTMKSGGLASCYDATTGKVIYQDERVGALGDYYSSAVAADGKVFIASQKGTVVVLAADGAFSVLAKNELGEQVFTTPAIVDGNLYLRGETHLFAFAGQAAAPAAPAKAAKAAAKPDPAFAPVVDDPKLPRVLLIGDSISIGYTVAVRELMRGKANIHRIPTNGGPTSNGVANLAKWLEAGKWDVIHFNWGLHDLKFMDDGKHQISLTDYEQNLRVLVKQMQATGAKLIWCSTTPVPDAKLSPPRKNEDVLAFNTAAKRVMDENKIAVDDLYPHAAAELAKIQLPANVHFSKEGSAYLAKQVARSLEAALPKQ